MYTYQGGKQSKRFSPGSDYIDQNFTGELSGVNSAGVLKHGICNNLSCNLSCG